MKSPIFCSISAHSSRARSRRRSRPPKRGRASSPARAPSGYQRRTRSLRPRSNRQGRRTSPGRRVRGLDLLQRPVSRMPADRGRRMHCVEQRGVRHAIPQRPTNPRPEVPSPRQLHLRDVVLDLQLFAERLERLPYAFAHVSVLEPGLSRCATGRRAALRRPPKRRHAAWSPPRPRSPPRARRGGTGARGRPPRKPSHSQARRRNGSSPASPPSASPAAAWDLGPHRSRTRPCGPARPCPDDLPKTPRAPARRSPSNPAGRGYPHGVPVPATGRRTWPRGTRGLRSAAAISDASSASLGSTRLQTSIVSVSPACSSKRGRTNR